MSAINFDDYRQFDAIGLAEKVKQGEFTATELLQTAIARAEQVNPSLNAIITPAYELAEESIATGLPEGPFTGVPFLLKDLYLELQGTPLRNGSACMNPSNSTRDCELVTRYKKAGLVMMGKTNTPEYGLVAHTEPKLFGATKNPWNPNFSPGGSSGGSAVAVAAGITPIASASDGGGSIRIPASFCGLFGLKPSRCRNPHGPYASEIWDGATVEHVLTRSVRDSAAMMDATIGADPSIPYPIDDQGGFSASLATEVRQLKIGYITKNFYGGEIANDAKAAVEHTARLLTDLGHQVEEVDINFDGEAMAWSYFILNLGHMAADLRAVAERIESRIQNLSVELSTKTMALLGQSVSAEEYVTARRTWNQLSQTMHMFHKKYDLMLTPTVGVGAMEYGAFELPWYEKLAMNVANAFGLNKLLLKSGVPFAKSLEFLRQFPFTQLANLTGAPAMSVPLATNSEGLPQGVQFMAPMADEKTLLQLARQLEIAQPWFNKVPDCN